MSAAFGHQHLHNRYRFRGTLILRSPLRVSSGRASEDTDAPLTRTRDGLPYIPGTSLRGVIRSELERILAGKAGDDGLTSCVLFSGADCNAEAKRHFRGKRPSDHDLAEYAETKLCDVCRLFGCDLFASRLVIEDAVPNPTLDQLRDNITLREGIAVDRDTGTMREGARFDCEVMEPGPTFTFRMQAENITEKDRQIINLIFSLLHQGLQLGSRRAAGLGKFVVGITEVTGFETPQALWDAVSSGVDPHKTLVWKEEPKC